ncbi:MAG: IspD/TarI family cytidylyltransferase [Chlamydiota bacterium]
MVDGLRIGAILLMGGEGRRFGSALPKQFHLLGGKRVFQYALETFLASQLFDEILLVCHTDWAEMVREQSNSIVRVILGGKTRQASSYAGLKGFSENPDIVLIHDAVRPFVTDPILRENVRQAILHGAVNTCIPTADTLVHAPTKRKILTIPKREEYLRGQTPQTFRMDWILSGHEKALSEGVENSTDDCQLVLNLERPIQIVAGDERNLKITSEFDLLVAEQLLSSLFSQIDKNSAP